VACEVWLCRCRKAWDGILLPATFIFFRGRSGSLIKALWHDGLGLSLYAKRLDRGRFIWPQTVGGALPLTLGQMGYLSEGLQEYPLW
jgi:transposase